MRWVDNIVTDFKPKNIENGLDLIKDRESRGVLLSQLRPTHGRNATE